VSDAATLGGGRPGPLDRALRLFTDVRAGESATALLLAANVFLVLFAYYLIKPARKALILSGAGAEIESYASAALAILLLGAVPAYGRLAARLPRRRLIGRVTLFFVACLIAFYALGTMGVDVGIPFFLWVGIFNVMAVAQFWSFANDVYSTDEGERLFPIVAFGASLGAVLGSVAAGIVIAHAGVMTTLLGAAAALWVGLLVTNAVDTRERVRTEAGLPLTHTTAELPAATGEFAVSQADGASAAAPTGGRGAAFRLVFADRYLLLIAVIVLLLNWVNTNGEYILSKTMETVAAGSGRPADQVIGEFYSGFFAVVNALGLVLQLFVVSRVLKYGGARIALAVLPVISLVAYSLMAFLPVLAAIRWAKTAENATDYSLNNTVRNVLFLPTTREQKYAAKQAIDSFFKVAGDLASAGLVFAGAGWLALAPRQFALVNLALVCVWLAAVWAVGRRYQRLSGR